MILKGSEDKDVSCHLTLDRSPDTDIRRDHRTDCWIQWDKLNCQLQCPGQILFHYCIIVCTIDIIPVDCKYYL